MHKTVYILGTGHCGSTLLGLILGSHSQCEYIGEYSFMFDKYNKPENIARIRKHGYCSLCENSCKYFDRQRTHDELYEMFGKILIDNSKKNNFAKDTMNEHSKFIFIVRNPLDVIGSYKKSDEFSKKKIRHVIKKNNDILKFLEDKQHVIVKYCDLANQSIIKECCNYIGIPFENKMVKYWTKQHHGNYNPKILTRHKIEIVYNADLLERKEKKFAVKCGIKTISRKFGY